MNPEDRKLLHRLVALQEDLAGAMRDLARTTNGLDRQAVKLVVDQLADQIRLLATRLRARVNPEDLKRFLYGQGA